MHDNKGKIEREHVMGMAASQARFLGLTARKTNVEYEGQQINQQRTTLGNQSANYYNQLLGMQVPVPPSVADFTKTVYTFDDGAITNSITSMIANTNGEYTVSYSRQWTDPHAIVSAPPTIVTQSKPPFTTQPNYVASDGNAYFVGGTQLRGIDGSIDANSTITDLNGKLGFTGLTATDGNTIYSGTDPRFAGKSAQECLAILQQETLYKNQLEQQYGKGTIITDASQIPTPNPNNLQVGGPLYPDNWQVRYTLNTSTNDWEPTFYQLSVLASNNTTFGQNGNSQSTIPAYQTGSAVKNDEIKNKTARFEMDATGRPMSVTFNPGDPDEVNYALTTNTITDQQAYDDKMNQYEFDKYQYDQQIQEVNAKINIIQTQDKNLELRLKQLDTEHDAIQTEMDAVSKVIQKNVESTFKTFG